MSFCFWSVSYLQEVVHPRKAHEEGGLADSEPIKFEKARHQEEQEDDALDPEEMARLGRAVCRAV